LELIDGAEWPAVLVASLPWFVLLLSCLLFCGGLWGGHRPMLRTNERQAKTTQQINFLFYSFSLFSLSLPYSLLFIH